MLKKSKGGPLYIFCPVADGTKGGKPGDCLFSKLWTWDKIKSSIIWSSMTGVSLKKIPEKWSVAKLPKKEYATNTFQ